MQKTGGRWRWRRGNPLRRRWDVLDAWLGLLTALALLLGAPGAGVAVGLSAYAGHLQERDRQLAERRALTGRLVDGVPAVHSPTGFTAKVHRVPAQVRWTGPDGRRHVSTVRVEPGTRKGARATVWIHRDGSPAEAPLSVGKAADDAVAAGLTTSMLLVLLCVAVRWSGRRYLDHVRLAQWGREWEHIGPRWKRHTI